MAHPLRRALLSTVAALCILAVGTPARADGTGTLQVALRGDDPLATMIVLTNSGDTACQVAISPLGTVALTRVESGGMLVEAIPVQAAFDDGFEAVLASRLRTLEPKASVEIPVRVVPVGPTGHAIETVAWSATAGSFGSLYPIKADQPLQLELTYAVPIVPTSGAALCAPTAFAMTAADAGRLPWIPLALGGLAAIVLVALVVVLALWHGRRQIATARSVAFMLVGLVGAVLLPADRARAEIIITDPSLDAATTACSGLLHSPGNDPAGILPALEAPGVRVEIVPDHTGDTHEIALSRTHIIIFWDVDDHHSYAGSGGNADPCDALYHEMHHGYQHIQGTYDRSDCSGSGIPTTEVLATRAQNLLRQRLGRPPRGHYGSRPLPTGDCNRPPPPRQCAGNGCGHSTGDPHLRTMDGVRYDFQAVGEFIAVRDTLGRFEIQVRQQPALRSRVVSVNTAVAMNVDGSRVEVRNGPTGLELLIAGAPKPLRATNLPGGASVQVGAARDVTVMSADGSRTTIGAIGPWGLVLSVEPADGRAGRLEGLLGDFDGDSRDDIRPRGGEPITRPTFRDLYPNFADSWRVDAASSLFTYPAGSGTDTFTDRTFPEREVVAYLVPNRAAAEAICRGLGVTDAAVLAGCVLDVALTGQPDFAVAAAAGQAFASVTDLGGKQWTVRVTEPGAPAKVEFVGTAGQKVFLDVPTTNLPDQCGVLDLYGPDKKLITSGCIIGGKGIIDGTVLPVTGTYTIAVEPANKRTGEARLRLITIVDQFGAITPDGPEVLAKVDKPGVVSRFNFIGTAGQKVFLDVPASTLPDQCGVLDLYGPDKKLIASGCVIGGKGIIDGTVLPATGTYTVSVDPGDRRTGEARLRLYLAKDQHANIAVNGPAVAGRIDQPGAVSVFTFTGSPGQRIFIDVTSTDLPDQCGVLDLYGPGRKLIASGCVAGGKGSLGDAGAVLSATGTYQLIVDPSSHATGQFQVRVRG